ncbi:MAG: DUF6632 domain-containing protein [Steroidobacteraceae bacterium]
MSRERVLKFVMILAGLLFSAGIFPLVMSLWQWRHSDDTVPMFLSLYVTLGVFLLTAVRNPAEHRSVISFTAWSSFAHAAVMLVQAYNNVAGRPELYGMSAILCAIGVPLIALAPEKRSIGLAAAPAN